MTLRESLLAHKYAQAFINIYGNQLQEKDAQALAALSGYLHDHHIIVFYLGLSLIPLDAKQKATALLLADISCAPAVTSLFNLLFKDARITIVPQILHDIVTLYYQCNGIVPFVITTSHAISSQALATIADFIAQRVGRRITFTSKVDPSLIAGVRALSETLLWDYSLRKQLKNVSLSLIH
ncbi:MAG TPA: F0F1 ATP synthase subunit delta [Candidatus Limnocylindria bacterium]|nr:F0F1 ATP synthase subunit delta [Candidatus Limnocylindria bacterium]